MKLARLRALVGPWMRAKPSEDTLAAASGAPEPSAMAPAAPRRGARAPLPPWSPERIALLDRLCGESHPLPGGREEVLRLVRPLRLKDAHTLLLLGAGTGDAARVITQTTGCWVSGFEQEPALVSVAVRRSAEAGLAKKAAIEPWQPSAPKFRAGFFDHALALCALRGAPAEPMLAALADAIKLSGQLVMVDLVADQALPTEDRDVAAWLRLEVQGGALPREADITRTLTQLGFDVRVSEDISAPYQTHALAAWREAVAPLALTPPDPTQAAVLVAEAERWLLRIRLLRTGRLRLIRWHAML